MSAPRLIFAGTPDFAKSQLEALLAQNFTICAVYTQPDRRAGRGRALQASPVKQLAEAHNIPVYQPQSLKTPESQDELAQLQPDLMIVSAYGLLLPPAALAIPIHGCWNVHASLLPRWRGASPIQQAILAGDQKTGITLMQMDAGLDTGNSLLSESIAITTEDTAGTLHDKLAELGSRVLLEGLRDIPRTCALGKPQEASSATHCPKIQKAQAKIDWLLPAEQIARQIRAFQPWPVAFSTIEEQTLRFWKASPMASEQALPGTILSATPEALMIATGNGALCVTHLQLPGKRTLPIKDLLNANQRLFTPGKQFL